MQVAGPRNQPDIRELLKDNPQFHRLVDIHAELSPELTSWGAQLDVLAAMQTFLKPGMHTLETGCGHSTVLFAATQTHHICVTPARGETVRVAEFCTARGLSTARLQFLIGNSQDVLAGLDPTLRLHLAFIDGGHFFPIPCFDWYYAGSHLVTGGLLVVDDVRIPTVRILFDFLRADANWRLVQLIGDTAFFRRIREAENLHDWLEQPYNRGYPDWSFLPLPSRIQHTLEPATTTLRRNLRRLRHRLRPV